MEHAVVFLWFYGAEMPRKIIPLSDTIIRNSKPQKTTYALFDGDGLLLRITIHGTKVWYFNYFRPQQSRRNNLKLGNYPALSLAAARKTVAAYRQLLVENIDPQRWIELQNSQASEEALNTLQMTCEKWFEVKFSAISARHAFNIRRSFEQHVFDRAGHLPLKDLNAQQIIEILKPLEKAGKLETLSRLCQRINELMTWAVNTGLVEFNRLTGIKAAFISPQTNNMKTLAPHELPQLMRRLSSASIQLSTRCLIEWQLHTMVRPGEAVKARWQDINVDKATWTIPAEFMKKRRPHVVPLTKQTLSLLRIMRPISGDKEYIFPSVRHKHGHINRETANMALKRMGFENRLVAHGMRSLASTILNEEGFYGDLVESALSHEDKNQVRRAYNKADYLKGRTEMMQWWSNHIEAASLGNLSMSSWYNKQPA
ncbi:integrase domain-containing protein [Rheinheimera aquimaris]|uniref:integrase domain-containing protein n=3 Tax=Rheinheimera TaxID=67575 RepID=UPI0026C04061|tara:strand:+ start:695 stop:1975 length:1281 start_codon:yes stop_codon:yes gene_type:complete